MSEYSAKVHRNPGGDTLVVEAGGKIEVQEGAQVTGLTGAAALATASETVLGGVKAAARTPETDTVEAKIGMDQKLYVPTYALPTASGTVLGGVHVMDEEEAASELGSSVDTEASMIPVTILPNGFIFVPVVAAGPSWRGSVFQAANQADIAADATLDALRTAYIDLIAKLKAAKIMSAGSGE